MVSLEHIKELITQCRKFGKDGLDNGINGEVPELVIDVVSPEEFLGAGGNPAIFVNSKTYKLMRTHHENWVENRTIAFKSCFLFQPVINIIGAIIHETGHAFNVAAKIPNTETNAYIFEIEMLLRLYQTKSPLLCGCTEKDLQSYFKSRLPYYNKGVTDSEFLNGLVKLITFRFNLNEVSLPEKQNKEKLFYFIPNKGPTLFAKNQIVEKEKEPLMPKVVFTPELKLIFYKLIHEHFNSTETMARTLMA